MAGTTRGFTGWLYAQRTREDDIGGFARTAVADELWPALGPTRALPFYHNYLLSAGATDAAIAALIAAYEEWETYLLSQEA